MLKVIIEYVFPFFGIGIIVFCILSFFFDWGSKLRGKVQEIDAFGVHLKISVVTLFLLIGVASVGSGFFKHIKEYDKEINTLKKELEKKIAQLEEKEEFEISAYVTLEGISEDNMPELEELKCFYYLIGSERERVDVKTGMWADQLRLDLKKIKFDMTIRKLELTNQSDGMTWIKEHWIPLQPSLELKKGQGR